MGFKGFERTKEVVKLIERTPEFVPPDWDQLDVTRRLAWIHKLEPSLAGVDCRPPMRWTLVDDEPEAFVGAYRRKDNRAFISEVFLKRATVAEAMGAITHIGTYAYHYAVIEVPGRHGEYPADYLRELMTNGQSYVYPYGGLEGRFDRVYAEFPAPEDQDEGIIESFSTNDDRSLMLHKATRLLFETHLDGFRPLGARAQRGETYRALIRYGMGERKIGIKIEILPRASNATLDSEFEKAVKYLSLMDLNLKPGPTRGFKLQLEGTPREYRYLSADTFEEDDGSIYESCVRLAVALEPAVTVRYRFEFRASIDPLREERVIKELLGFLGWYLPPRK